MDRGGRAGAYCQRDCEWPLCPRLSENSDQFDDEANIKISAALTTTLEDEIVLESTIPRRGEEAGNFYGMRGWTY